MFWAFNLQPTDDLPSNAREIPDVAGMTATRRRCSSSQELGLPATRVDETSDTVPADQVIRTDPGAGEIVDTDTAVTVYVSTGREPVTVPDVRNKPLDQAKADLTAAGLAPGTETRENSPSVAADTVLGTTPEAGSTDRGRGDRRPPHLERHGHAHRPHGPDARPRHPRTSRPRTCS